MKRIVVKLADPAVEPDALAAQGADLARELTEAEVVRVSGSGRVLLLVPDADAADAVARLSSLSEVAWAEPDGGESAQDESTQSESAQDESTQAESSQPGVPESTDGDPQSS